MITSRKLFDFSTCQSSIRKGIAFGSSLLMTVTLASSPSLAKQSSLTPPPSPLCNPTHIKVQEIKSQKGITAWIVENHEIPVVSVALAFRHAGSSADPKGLAGMSMLISSLLDEGAGDLKSQEFKKYLLKYNIQLSVNAAQDVFQITFRTIKKNIQEAFHVLKLILTKPRFDESPFARVKNQILSIFEQSLHNEHEIGAQEMNVVMFGDHPYATTVQTVLKEFSKITDKQMNQFMRERFTKDKLLISAVGDITVCEFESYLDKTFNDLPDKATPLDIKDVTFPSKGTTKIIPFNIPQSLVRFAQPGLKRTDPDFYAGFILLKIMGDGLYDSRLWDEIREKRGLAYEIQANLSWSEHAALILGGTATKSQNVSEVIKLIRKVWTDTQEGVTQSELDDVKRRTIGNFALNFSSTLQIAKALLVYQIDNLGIDFINKRNDIIAALTLNDINRVTKRILNTNELSFVVCGDPKALSLQGLTQENKAGANEK